MLQQSKATAKRDEARSVQPMFSLSFVRESLNVDKYFVYVEYSDYFVVVSRTRAMLAAYFYVLPSENKTKQSEAPSGERSRSRPRPDQ